VSRFQCRADFSLSITRPGSIQRCDAKDQSAGFQHRLFLHAMGSAQSFRGRSRFRRMEEPSAVYRRGERVRTMDDSKAWTLYRELNYSVSDYKMSTRIECGNSENRVQETPD
jgi:hypothetical protein